MDPYKLKLKKWYDSTAERYDSWGDREGEYSSESKPIEIINFNQLLNLIEIKNNAKILDIATGTGTYLLEVLKRGGIGYGIDISSKMIDQLKRKIESRGLKNRMGKVITGDAEKLNFLDNFFDIIICIGMFDYYSLDQSKIFLKEIKRVLKRNGKIILDFPNKNNKEIYEFQKKERSVGHEVYIYEKTKLIEFLEKNNFKILKSKEAGIEIQFLLEIKK
jgi:MPBQ/MSBQ methyltransferase